MRVHKDVTPHPDGERLAVEAVRRGQRLACAVRDDGAWEVARITDALTRDELVALAVALAAMVPVDQPASGLLAWLDEPAAARVTTPHDDQDDADEDDGGRLPAGHRFPDLSWSSSALELAHRTYTSGEHNAWSIEGEQLWQQLQALPPRRRARRRVAS